MVFTANIVSERTFPIGIHRMEPQDDMHLHRHDNIELVLITGGTGRHRTLEGTWPLARGDVFVVPVDMAHGYEATDDLRLVNVVYDARRIELPLHRLSALPGYRPLVALEPTLRSRQAFAGHLHLSGPLLTWLEAAIADLARELHAREAGWQQAAGASLLTILIRLARAYAAHDAPGAQLLVRIGEVLAHVESHLAADHDVDRLAQRAGVSASTLQRSFRSLFGASVLQHVLELRMRAARELLLGSDLSVAEVGRRVGIGDPNYFTRLFTQRTGSSPRAFRSAAVQPPPIAG